MRNHIEENYIASKEGKILLERNNGWLHMVATLLKQYPVLCTVDGGVGHHHVSQGKYIATVASPIK